ncbi:MAG: CHASE2 domain-containing protein [Myxococcota bacterium]|nr:CHASE2 domain-containing protein [Myxococcota bacterium]
MRRVSPPIRTELLATAAVVAFAVGVLWSGLAAPIQRIAADALVRASIVVAPPPPAELPDAAVVALDPQSLRAHPAWPWPRSLYARAVDRLEAADVRVVAFDIDFSTPRDLADDAEFAASIAASGSVVLAAFRQLQELPGGATLEVANLPIEPLAASAAGLGSVLMPVDPDGVVRRAPRASDIAGRPLVSLAEAALDVALERAPRPPRGPAPTFRVDYRRVQPPVPVIPIADVLDDRFDPTLVAGRVVFIGATAAEFQDLWSTPVGPARPGVWIQAIAYRTLAAREIGSSTLRDAPPLATACAALLLCVVAGSVAGLERRRRAPALALLLLTSTALDVGLVLALGLIVDPVVPLLAVALRYVLGLEGVRERLRRVLAQREHSLDALARVGEVATAGSADDPLGLALALLGDVVDASGVAFLRAGDGGHLDGRRIEWRRRGAGAIGDLAAAEAVLESRRTRVFEGDLPGHASRGLAVYEPLFSGERAVGVLVVERDDESPLEPVQLRTVATVGTQIALSADNLRLIENLRQTFDSSVEAIASAVEARDGYTESHCRRLAVYSAAMADRLGLPPEEVEAVRLGALLHDVGKIGIRDDILLKPGRLSREERFEMERHADVGHRIVVPIRGLTATTAACVRHHHERWDGRGYPDRLAGEEIPLAARIVAVVDVWDALSTRRPYKRAYSPGEVRARLLKGRGGQFDPEIVDLFLVLLDEEGEDLALVAGRPSS